MLSWRNWITHLTTNQESGGSNPSEGTKKQNEGELLKKRGGARQKIVGTYGVDGEVLTKK